jgi:hypothetical protein
MQDLIANLKERMKWRKAPEVTDVAYEIKRLKHDVLDIALRLDDLEKAHSSSNSLDKSRI